MKSSQLNNENPPASASSPRDNPCLGNDPTVAALDVFADNGISYLLPYAQFLYAEKMSNPALEKESDAPPEKMLIRFATAEVVVLGSGLKRLEQGIQKCGRIPHAPSPAVHHPTSPPAPIRIWAARR